IAVAARDHQQIAHIDRRGFERDDHLVFGRCADIGNVDHLHDVSWIPECFDLDRLHDRFSKLCTMWFRQNTSRARSSASLGSKLRGLAIRSKYALTVKSQSAVSKAATAVDRHQGWSEARRRLMAARL